MSPLGGFLKRIFSRKEEIATQEEAIQEDIQITDIHAIITQLKIDHQKHTDVGSVLTIKEIQQIESQLGLKFPPSYTIFLQEFGDGAYWLYGVQPIDSIRNPFWFKDAHPKAPSILVTERGDELTDDKLLCLMSEDSNGGSWCWITTRADSSGEYPLAYYGFAEDGILADGGLFYELPNFTEWLKLLVTGKDEVIRILDKENKLVLG